MKAYTKVILLCILVSTIFANHFRVLKNNLLEESKKFLKDSFNNQDEIINLIDNISDFISENEVKGIGEFTPALDSGSIICRGCSALFDLIRNSDYYVQKVIIKWVAVQICVLGKMYVRPVCQGAVNEMLDPIIDSVKNHYLDKDLICPLLWMCPQVYKTIDIQAYREDILKDKPESTPSKISNKKPNKIIKLLHVSDIHTDLEYLEGARSSCNEPVCCREESTGVNPTSKAGKWGSIADCDLPTKTFDKFVDFVNTNFKIDLSMWTGDNTSHDIWHQSYKRNEENTKRITAVFKEKFNFTIFPTLGNHESFPVNVYDFITKREIDFNSFFADEWYDWIGPEASLLIKKDGYYSTYYEKYNLKIISLNSQACNDQNWFLFRDQTDPGGMLKWLRSELYIAEQNNQLVYIISHFSPHSCLDKFGLILDAILDRFSNIISGQFVGHSHGAGYSVVRDSKTKKIVNFNLCPSSLTTFSELQPSFRIFDIDQETMRAVNFQDYRLNLTKWNNDEDENIQWDMAYDFLKEYNLTDMSMESFEILTEKLRTDNETIQKYAYNQNSGVGPSPYSNSTRARKDRKHTYLNENGLDLSYYCDTFNVDSYINKCKNSTGSYSDSLMEALRGPWKEKIN